MLEEVIGVILRNLSIIISILAITYTLFQAIFSHPSLEVYPAYDEPTDQDRKRRYMWYHIKVRNKKSSLSRLFRRESAIRCKARIDFLDKRAFLEKRKD